MEKIATDIYTFEKLRKNGFTYVDKTDALYAMASGDVGNRFFCLSVDGGKPLRIVSKATSAKIATVDVRFFRPAFTQSAFSTIRNGCPTLIA